MKILCIHAHFDDYEFVASGTFEVWRRKLGGSLKARVIVCTDGKAGHHFRPREETGLLRLKEQEASAKIGGYEFELLKLPDGQTPREACLQVTTPLLAALWKSIREFEPDYIFCPPLPADPLAGIHVVHVAVAEAVRRVAYMINVPHAFTPEYPADETVSQPCRVPVIVNVYDGYMAGANTHDFAVDVEEAFPKICEMSWQHQSQIAEWLPWVGRHDLKTPASLTDWTQMLRARFQARNREMGIASARMLEVFTVTAWGAPAAYEQLLTDFPNIVPEASNLDRLKKRLQHQ
jgi:LmbE family N-acetylglucosaminyl deacetylase